VESAVVSVVSRPLLNWLIVSLVSHHLVESVVVSVVTRPLVESAFGMVSLPLEEPVFGMELRPLVESAVVSSTQHFWKTLCQRTARLSTHVTMYSSDKLHIFGECI
jgi:hypothetical protein